MAWLKFNYPYLGIPARLQLVSHWYMVHFNYMSPHLHGITAKPGYGGAAYIIQRCTALHLGIYNRCNLLFRFMPRQQFPDFAHVFRIKGAPIIRIIVALHVVLYPLRYFGCNNIVFIGITCMYLFCDINFNHIPSTTPVIVIFPCLNGH